MADADQATAVFPRSLSAFNQLPMRLKLTAGIGVAVAFALVIATWMWARQPDYTVLFSNLNDRDGGEIIAVLQQQNIPYQYAEGGGAILVPATQVHDVRLKLASQGLPRGGLVGFEVLENQKIGASQFLEQINYQRALEGELARTISTISAVKGARVHLAMPKQTAFLRDEQKPTASVLVNLQPGRSLEGVQIAGIVHLVSSSVPDLNPLNVSVIDQDGHLITQKNENERTAGMDPTQLKYVREIEADYAKRVETLIGRMVGKENVKAQVTADVDFSQVDQVAESYKPNPTPDSTIRSQQTNETGSASPAAAGVPGALSNQPPAPATAPITTPPAPGTPGATTASSGSGANFTRSSTTNYEVDKTIRHVKGVPGVIRRLAVAVLVNQKPDPSGKPNTKPVPLSEGEIQQITSIAQEAVGFSKDRGDTLNVVNAAFTESAPDALPETPFYRDPFLIAMIKDLGRYGVAALVAALVWFKLLKPLFVRVGALPPDEKKDDATGGEGADGEPALTGEGLPEHGTAHGPGHEGEEPLNEFEVKLAKAREFAKQDPKAVANVIKEWLGGGDPR